VDTFAFRNDSRIHHRGKPDLYASWCFVMARAVVQFQRFAHFEPGAPRLAAAKYTALVQRITRLAPWRAPLPMAERVVLPGFGSLHELTREAEAAVKAGLPRRLWTILHWTNWRIIFPLSLPGIAVAFCLNFVANFSVFPSANLVGVHFREPDVAVGAGCDPEGLAVGGGDGGLGEPDERAVGQLVRVDLGEPV